jgi:ElaB/YqjD/DUF883 family membrane-anchored ribosome-binding protein
MFPVILSKMNMRHKSVLAFSLLVILGFSLLFLANAKHKHHDDEYISKGDIKKVTRTAGKISEDAKDRLKHAGTVGKEKAEQAKETAKDVAESAYEKTGEAAHAAKKKAKSAYETGKDILEGAAHTAGETAHDAKEKIKGAYKAGKTKISEAAESAEELFEDVTSKAKKHPHKELEEEEEYEQPYESHWAGEDVLDYQHVGLWICNTWSSAMISMRNTPGLSWWFGPL